MNQVGFINITRPIGLVKEFLKTSQLFKELSDAELDEIVRLCREKVYEAGAVIFSEGDVAEDLYIVEYGKVVLDMTMHFGSGSGGRGTLGVVTEGQVFGLTPMCDREICVIQTFTNSARCVEKTKVLALNGEQLCHFFQENAYVGYKIMQRLASIWRSRFQDAGDMIAHVLSIASHDLKSPLAAVESYHQVILDGYAGEVTEKQKNMLIRSSERIKALLNLIDNVLDISRIESGELEVEALSLLDVANISLGSVRPLAEQKQIKLNTHLPKKLSKVSGSAIRLEQVFTNLLGNAVKFTDKGGTITLRIDEEADHIITIVMDTGIGIPPEELPRIFDDFYRGIRAEEVEGVGLGLSISKKIIEAHKGRIWVESPCPESGVGSKFTFTLPINLVTIKNEKEEV